MDDEAEDEILSMGTKSIYRADELKENEARIIE